MIRTERCSNVRSSPRPPTTKPPKRRSSGRDAGLRANDIRMELYDDNRPFNQQPQRAKPFPYFCCFAITACCTVMLLEIRANGWAFQPFSCAQGDTECVPNPMFGPTSQVLDDLGAKNDMKIQRDGEWWRVFACNWLHAGLIHLAMNMIAICNLGFGLEKMFGFWKIGTLYILSGLFGTMVSMVFLPDVLSVGASASVFGRVGACWADVIINLCARCTLRDSGICTLLLATVINVLIGLTPYVDNFMHMGGMVAGLLMGLVLFSQKHEDESGRRRYSPIQISIALLSLVGVAGLAVLAVIAGTSKEVQDYFRGCTFCEHINCVEFAFFTNEPWYSCNLAHVGCFTSAGSCGLTQPNATTILAQCNFNDGSGFPRSCNLAEAWCSVDLSSEASRLALCRQVCSAC